LVAGIEPGTGVWQLPDAVVAASVEIESLRSLVGVGPYREFQIKLQLSRLNLIY